MINVKETALQVINSYPEYAKEALENVYRGKVFVVFQPYRNTIEKIAKTKRGAEGYIKKQQAFTYYDEYTNELVTCGSGLTVLEIDPTQIENPQTSKTLWYRFMKEYHGQTWYYDNIVKIAKQLNVSDDVMEYVLQSVEDMKNNRGLTVLEEAEQPTTQQEPQINEQTQTEAMPNTVTKKQRYALYIASGRKIKTNELIISKEKASELISRSMNGEDITSELQAIAKGKQTEEVAEQTEAQQEGTQQVETLTDAYNDHKELINLIATNRQFNDALRMTDLKPYIVTLQNAYYDVKENNKYSFVQPIDVYNAVNVLMNSELFHALKSEYITESEHDNTQQAKEESKKQPQKIKVKEITFLWSESPIIKDNTKVSTWEEANKIIKDIAFRKDTSGYDKTAFRVEWEDGGKYEGRIDVQASDLYKNAPLSEHIENYALAMAGMKKPTHWTQERYENSLNTLKSDREAWKEFLDSYMLYDEETPKNPTDPSDQPGERNNSDNMHELGILQEQSNHDIINHDTMQEEAKKLNNMPANESLEDLQVKILNNSEQETLQVSYKINEEKNGIELYFSEKPSEAIREQLKQYGFKWSRQGFWYAKKTDERLQFVLSLLSDSYNSELTDEQRKTLEKRLKKENIQLLRLFKAKNSDFVLLECINTNLTDQKPFYFLIRSNGEEIGMGYNSDILNDYTLIYTYTHNSQDLGGREAYPDINIDDIGTYVIDERLQEAEHAASWIFRTQKQDHTKSIQELFSSYNSKVIELLEQTDNERIIYNLKKALQSFKKRYFDNYMKRLRNKANNPSWVVTGRAGRNSRKDAKANARYDKLTAESIQLMKEIDRAIDRAKDEIRREKEQRIKEAVESVKNDLTFTTMTKEIEYMGYRERKRVYVYGDYWTARLWGCFRIFKGNKEIHEMKSTDKLDDAKRYIAYLVQQDKESQKVS